MQNVDRAGRAEPSTGKKPYHKPAFKFERAFETMALTCGKISTTQQQCATNTKNS
jgi:hypothetical protein